MRQIDEPAQRSHPSWHTLPALRPLRSLLLGLGVLVVLAACAAGPNPALGSGAEAAGFWLGLWHGFISPVTFVVSLFNDQVSVYEVHNSGNWYDAGFMGGVSTIFSSSARSGAYAAGLRRGREGR